MSAPSRSVFTLDTDEMSPALSLTALAWLLSTGLLSAVVIHSSATPLLGHYTAHSPDSEVTDTGTQLWRTPDPVTVTARKPSGKPRDTKPEKNSTDIILLYRYNLSEPFIHTSYIKHTFIFSC